MVDEKKIKKLLPKILTVGDPRYSNRHSEYVAKEAKLRRLQRNNKSWQIWLDNQIRQAKRAFDVIEKALQEGLEW